MVVPSAKQAKTAMSGISSIMEGIRAESIVMPFNEEDKILYCMITLTTQFCPMGDSILLAAKEALQTAFEEYSIHIDLTFDPAWNHKMLSDFGKEFLNQL